MCIETEEELLRLQHIGAIVAQTLSFMLASVQVGITTKELDQIGRLKLQEFGARSAPEVTYGFPGATCISINEEIAHGIPGSRRVKAGDILNIDVSAEKNGFFADTGASIVVASDDEAKNRLCAAAVAALRAALKVSRAGASMRAIGAAIEAEANAQGYEVIRNLGSHGIGRALHEEPKFIPGFDSEMEKRVLKEGMVITIEPFLSTITKTAVTATDGWTLRAEEGNYSAQFEHSLVITQGEPLILTTAAGLPHC